MRQGQQYANHNLAQNRPCQTKVKRKPRSFVNVVNSQHWCWPDTELLDKKTPFCGGENISNQNFKIVSPFYKNICIAF